MTASSGPKEQWLHKFERLILLLLLINPFLDIFNGVFTYILTLLTKTPFSGLGVSVTPSLVLRMALLAGLFVYFLLRRDKEAFFAMAGIGATWLMTLIGMVFFSAYETVSFFSEFQYMARFVFNLSVLLLFGKILLRQLPDRQACVSFLARVFAWTLAVLSTSIVVSSLFKVGYFTYADRYGYRGSRGFFYAGNDITAVLMVLLPLVLCLLIAMPRDVRKKQIVFYAYAAGVTLTALILIGSKTAFVAVIASGIVGAVCMVWEAIAKRAFYPVFRTVFAVLMCGALFFGLMLPDMLQKKEPGVIGDVARAWETPGQILETEGMTTALLSGRQVKMLAKYDEVKVAGPYAFLFGLGRGSQVATLEMDLFEFLFFYGLLGSAALLWAYARDGGRAIWRFIKKPSVGGLGALAGLGMTVGYGLMAGHVFFSVTSGFYLAIVLVFCNLFFVKKEENRED